MNMNILLQPALRTAEEIGIRAIGAARVLLQGMPQAETDLTTQATEHIPAYSIFGVNAYDLDATNLVIATTNEGPVTGPFGPNNQDLVTAPGRISDKPAVSLLI